MRVFLTSLMAFIISGFAGGMVAQVIAVTSDATEEFILVFMASALVTIVISVLFFIAQLVANPASAVSVLGRVLVAILVVIGIGLAIWSLWAADFAPESKEIWLVVGLVLPGIVTVLTHWLFVAWRVKNTPAQFGRGEG